jgi:hypothetical protein
LDEAKIKRPIFRRGNVSLGSDGEFDARVPRGTFGSTRRASSDRKFCESLSDCGHRSSSVLADCATAATTPTPSDRKDMIVPIERIAGPENFTEAKTAPGAARPAECGMGVRRNAHRCCHSDRTFGARGRCIISLSEVLSAALAWFGSKTRQTQEIEPHQCRFMKLL